MSDHLLDHIAPDPITSRVHQPAQDFPGTAFQPLE